MTRHSIACSVAWQHRTNQIKHVYIQAAFVHGRIAACCRFCPQQDTIECVCDLCVHECRDMYKYLACMHMLQAELIFRTCPAPSHMHSAHAIIGHGTQCNACERGYDKTMGMGVVYSGQLIRHEKYEGNMNTISGNTPKTWIQY